VDLVDESELIIHDPCIERVDWISLDRDNPFTLPIDKIVFEKLRDTF
jgi:hypothetical protein